MIDPKNLEPAKLALSNFARLYPQFGIRPDAVHSFTHLRRTHGDKLLKSGACYRPPSGTWLADKTRFPDVLLAILLGQPIPAQASAPAPKRKPK